jgi:MGT family glycosyltransferase
MAIGEQVRREDLGEIPANFDVRTYFPQPVVLQHAKAFLSHAGMNSVMEALLNQVPLATFPQTAEQQANAARVAELGLGRTIAELSPESLRSTIDAVAADSAIRANLAAMAAQVQEAGGSTAAADAVEDYLATAE